MKQKPEQPKQQQVINIDENSSSEDIGLFITQNHNAEQQYQMETMRCDRNIVLATQILEKRKKDKLATQLETEIERIRPH